MSLPSAETLTEQMTSVPAPTAASTTDATNVKWVSGSRGGAEAAAAGQPPVQLPQVRQHQLVPTETRLSRGADGALKAWRWCAVSNGWVLKRIYTAIIPTAAKLVLMRFFWGRGVVTLMCHCSFNFGNKLLLSSWEEAIAALCSFV